MPVARIHWLSSVAGAILTEAALRAERLPVWLTIRLGGTASCATATASSRLISQTVERSDAPAEQAAAAGASAQHRVEPRGGADAAGDPAAREAAGAVRLRGSRPRPRQRRLPPPRLALNTVIPE
eukprot:2814748-Rhodomonas_salina.4